LLGATYSIACVSLFLCSPELCPTPPLLLDQAEIPSRSRRRHLHSPFDINNFNSCSPTHEQSLSNEPAFTMSPSPSSSQLRPDNPELTPPRRIDPSLRLRRAIHANNVSLTQRILQSHPPLIHNPDISPLGGPTAPTFLSSTSPTNGSSGLGNSNTSLHLASSLGHVEIVKVLLHLGHEQDGTSLNEEHQTPLMLASACGWTDVVLVLCQWDVKEGDGKIVGRQDKRGRNAVMEAARGGHDTVIQILLTYAPPLKINSPNSSTAGLAALYKYPTTSSTSTTDSASNSSSGRAATLATGAAETSMYNSRDRSDSSQSTASFQSSVSYQSTSTTSLHPQATATPYLDAPTPASALLSQNDSDGNTALHFASSHGHLLVLRTLLAAGADAERRNVWSWTAIAYSSTVAAEVYFKGLVAEVERRREGRRTVIREGRGGGVRLVDGDD
jgi:ankyrin repeat protein